MFHSTKTKDINSAASKTYRFITAMLAVMLLLACTACAATDSSNGSKMENTTSSPNTAANDATTELESDEPSQESNDTVEPIDELDDNIDLEKVARSYKEILEATDFPDYPTNNGVFIDADICILDICGDTVPELLYIIKRDDDKIRWLHIWTYTDEAIEILSETVIDATQENGAGSYGVVTSNDGYLYVYQSGASGNAGYRIYFRYAYKEDQQKYITEALTSNNVIKYVHGYDIFDGYGTEDWDNLEKFGEQEQELLANMQYFLFQASGFLDSSSYYPKSMTYNNAMEYLEKMGSGQLD